MMIDLIGGGSLGLLYGGKLAAAGADVRLWCRTPEQAAKLASRGITIRDADGGTESQAKAGSFFAGPLEGFAEAWTARPGRWILLMTKQKDTEEACRMSAGRLASGRRVTDHPPGVVCFQNGYGHMEKLEKLLPGWPLYAAVTTEGAKRADACEVVHAGAGTTWLGPAGREHARHMEKRPEELVQMLQKAGFSAVLANDIDRRIYRKLLVNSVINPLTALWNVPNGELLASSERLRTMSMLLQEALAVYDASGIAWEEDIWDQILEVCRATAGNISSMLKDVRNGAETEIDWINGAVIGLANQAGVRAPLHELMVGLVKGLSIREE